MMRLKTTLHGKVHYFDGLRDRTFIPNIYTEGMLPTRVGGHIAVVAAEMITNKSNIKNISH